MPAFSHREASLSITKGSSVSTALMPGDYPAKRGSELGGEVSKAPGKTTIFCLDKRTGPPILKELWLIINSLRIRGQGYFRLGIYEPDG
jgi:hypothetical protein